MKVSQFIVKRFSHLSSVIPSTFIMGRDHHKFNKNQKYNKFNNKGNFNKNYDNSWQTDKRLLEENVGINKYISDIEGFHGIIKAR